MALWFWNTNTDGLYADEKWLCWWEDPEEEEKLALSKAKKIWSSFGNRNALHVDVTWAVAENENLVWRLFNSFAWIRDDDTHMKWKWFWWLADFDGLKNEPVSMIEYPWITESNDWILTKNKIYSPWNWIDWVQIVKLNDEGEYIFEARRAIFDEIKRFLIRWWDFKYKDLLLWDENYREFLRSQWKNIDHLLFNWHITREEIVEIIEKFFEIQSEIIAGYLLDWQINLETITPEDRNILAWGVTRNSLIEGRLSESRGDRIGFNIFNIRKWSDDWKLLEEYLAKLWIK